MKSFLFTAISLAFTVPVVQADVLFFDNFNSYSATASPLSANAAFAANYTTPTGPSLSAASGLSGSVGLDNSNDSTFVRKNVAIDLSQGPATVSIYFQYGTAGGIAGPQIGFTLIPTGNVTGAGDISGRLDGNKLRLRLNNATFDTDSNTQSLTSGNWYQLAFSATRTSTADQITVLLSLYGSDAAGNLTGLIDSFGGTLTDATIYNDTSLYAVVRENTSIPTLDNFSVTQIPEPATLALLSLGSLLIFRPRKTA